MTVRLVVGGGTVGQALVHSLSSRPGTVVVADDDENRVRTLREEGVAAETAPLTDSDALEEVAARPDTVAVAPAATKDALEVVRAARDAFPDAYLLAYTGLDATLSDGVAAVADDVVDPLSETTDFLIDRIGSGGVRTRKLVHTLRSTRARWRSSHTTIPTPTPSLARSRSDTSQSGRGCRPRCVTTVRSPTRRTAPS